MTILPLRRLAAIISSRTLLISSNEGRSKSTMVTSFCRSFGSTSVGERKTTFFGLGLCFKVGTTSLTLRITWKSGRRPCPPK